ncbi:MAG: hypothetical protein NTW29_01685 [Bacteroidetes bacterium]|nr:hypothetical protein [Bacteroidota bacterium]
MNSEETPSPDYLKGFNYGYMIAEHVPDLAKQLSTATGASDRFVGMKHGIEQFELEKSKSDVPKWLNPDRLKDLDSGPSKDKEDKVKD